MIFNSKIKTFILFLIFLLVEGIGIPLSWQIFQSQPAGVYKVQPWILWEGYGILITLTAAGIFGWISLFFTSEAVSDTPSRSSTRIWTGLAAAGGYLALAVTFIHATPLRVLLASWFTPIWLIGWVVIVRAVVKLDIRSLIRRLSVADWAMVGIAFLLIKAQQEFKIAAPLEVYWRNWHYIFLAFNTILMAAVWIIKENWSTYRISLPRWVEIRQRFRPIIVVIALIPTILIAWYLFWLDSEQVASGAFLRLEGMILAALLLSIALENTTPKWISSPTFLFSLTGVGFAVMAGSYLSQVTDHPFGLYWSEGNRFYDYSLIFGKSIYQYTGELQPNYFSPGRYGLWGLPFLISGLPIWVHRLWNAILYLVPGVVLGWLLGKGFANRLHRWACAFGTAIFFNQGPVYPTLTLAVILPVIFMRSGLGWRILVAVAGSLFAGLSRFTWVLAIAGMVGLIDLLLFYPARKGNWIQRLIPTGILIVAGLVPGMAVSWPEVFSSQGEMIQSQALLWYRLWPNSTYSFGILLGSIMATGAMLILVLNWMASRARRLDIWQSAAILAAVIGLLIAGLVASVKIGGGSNLHNLDMYFAVLLLVFILFLQEKELLKESLNRSWAQRILFGLAILLPILSLTWSDGPLVLPKQDLTQFTLGEIKKESTQRAETGEVLFLDQRQLITFGEVTDIELVPDYEKKYMMDQAMAGNQGYFARFYEDLQKKRFALIVSEPLNISQKTNVDDFSEENNAWVQHVTIPVYEYYTSIYLDKKNNIQLFIPK